VVTLILLRLARVAAQTPGFFLFDVAAVVVTVQDDTLVSCAVIRILGTFIWLRLVSFDVSLMLVSVRLGRG